MPAARTGFGRISTLFAVGMVLTQVPPSSPPGWGEARRPKRCHSCRKGTMRTAEGRLQCRRCGWTWYPPAEPM